MTMKPTDYSPECPYAGLRSFTEDESLYFKGRDSQVEQISDLLEQSKFLMVTGASGEGKSSLIYAGLIPNARAGFFKAQYTNWVVADFRPERSPLSNMSAAIAEALGAGKDTVDTELRRGYSSLIDLYLNSGLYNDESDAGYAGLSDTLKKERKRKAANLLVIVDQFEEFFTNPENFSNETPSEDSQVVVNLALETARIALKRNLPVYVVCTMRSDFIGQCVAFRGLPEYIGFSQFFVPRLKRKDFKQVIEEPAILSGNRISQRLIERIVYDLAEGVDQLPVLQHALSQIWLAASQGSEEMDLIHYAMVGGMPAVELPDEDQIKFQHWLEGQPDFKKNLLRTTGLHKIIEFHANVLYEGAWSHYNQLQPQRPITIQTTKRVIAMTFACLTKIDNSRAVRNRMTLREITRIINDPGLTIEQVGDILTLFREEGNSFIRPYKTSDPATHQLSADSVLDITHEALIRNWNKLNQWAKTEFEFYETWIDFRKQLRRWKDSGKQRGYLLPLGPLTYFENWYSECKPNPPWISRYTDQDSELPEKLLSETQEYLKRSSRRVLISRTFMKYGTQRVATFAAIVLMMIMSGFYWNDAINKKNERVIARITGSAEKLLRSEDVRNEEKGTYLIVQEGLKPGSLVLALKALDNPKDRVSIAIDSYLTMLTVDNHFNLPVKLELCSFIENELHSFEANGKDDAFLLRQVNRYLVRLVFDQYYNPQNTFNERSHDMTELLHTLILKFYNNTPKFEASVPTELNQALQLWLTLSKPGQDQISEMLASISPFSSRGEVGFRVYYQKGSYDFDGARSLDYNGGYHTLALLYAAAGDENKVIACFEESKVLPEYFTGRLFSNYNNVIGFFYRYGHRSKVPTVMKWISTAFAEDSPKGIFKNILNRSGYLSRWHFMNFIKFSRNFGGYFNLNLYWADREQVNQIAEDYEKVLNSLPDKNEQNFLLAMHHKRLAMFEDKYNFDRGLPRDQNHSFAVLDKAMAYFNAVDPVYLKNKTSPVIPYWSDGVRTPEIMNRHLFIYPDYMDGWFSRTYHTDLFFRYLNEKKLLDKFFSDDQGLFHLRYWLSRALEIDPNREMIAHHNMYPLSDTVLNHVAMFLDKKAGQGDYAYIVLANRNFERGDTVIAMTYFRKIKLQNAVHAADLFEYVEKSLLFNYLRELSMNLTKAGKYQEAQQVVNQFEFPRERAFSYIFNSEVSFNKSYNPIAFSGLDSAMNLMTQENFSALRPELDYRNKLVNLLGQIGGEKMNGLANGIVQDFTEQNKFNGITSKLRGIVSERNYYLAWSAMPSTLTETQELICYYYLLNESGKSGEIRTAKEWRKLDDYLNFDLNFIFYVPF